MRSLLRELSQRCIVLVLYTACFNTCQIVISHESTIPKTILMLLAANTGASVLTANAIVLRFDRMPFGSPVSSRAATITLAPAAFMVVVLSWVRAGETELPLLFAIGYFVGLTLASLFLAFVAIGDGG